MTPSSADSGVQTRPHLASESSARRRTRAPARTRGHHERASALAGRRTRLGPQCAKYRTQAGRQWQRGRPGPPAPGGAASVTSNLRALAVPAQAQCHSGRVRSMPVASCVLSRPAPALRRCTLGSEFCAPAAAEVTNGLTMRRIRVVDPAGTADSDTEPRRSSVRVRLGCH